MATKPSTGVKRKKPPTFQHLPVNRAKKLKKSWVEVQKIKSKWKAQKRKEGLVAPRIPSPDDGDEDDEKGGTDGESEHEELRGERSGNEGTDSTSGSEEGEESGEGESASEETGTQDNDSGEEHTPPKHGKCPISSQRNSSRGRGQHSGRGRYPDKRAQEDAQPSFRELQNKAYSRSSLHTYKSHSSQNGGRGRGRGSRGRGQPDMRLRMNAMLERIKRDYT